MKITDSDAFWKTVLPHFTQKMLKELILLRRKMSYQVMKKFALLLSLFFSNTMSNLNTLAIGHSHSNLQNRDPILTTVNSYMKF